RGRTTIMPSRDLTPTLTATLTRSTATVRICRGDACVALDLRKAEEGDAGVAPTTCCACRCETLRSTGRGERRGSAGASPSRDKPCPREGNPRELRSFIG